jgi:hypothetical protein
LVQGKKEEDFKLIECVTLEERAGKGRHEDPILAIFGQVAKAQGESPAEGSSRQNLIVVKFLPKIGQNRYGESAARNSPRLHRRSEKASAWSLK